MQSYTFEDLAVGMSASLTNTVTKEIIDQFAVLSGDTNPVHIDEAYAAGTMFKACIAHGMLTASYISAVFGTRMPGPGAIYVSQTLNFKAPVRIGDEVVSTVEVEELFVSRNRCLFQCRCEVAGRPVLEGEAMLIVPSAASSG
ncbi:MAG: MaoC family dehydratase [Pseudomonadota bacterium]